MVECIETRSADRAPREEQGGGNGRQYGRAGARQAGEQAGGGREGERHPGL